MNHKKYSGSSLKTLFAVAIFLLAGAGSGASGLRAEELKKWEWDKAQKAADYQGSGEADGKDYRFRTPETSVLLPGEAKTVCDRTSGGRLKHCRAPRAVKKASGPAAAAAITATADAADAADAAHATDTGAKYPRPSDETTFAPALSLARVSAAFGAQGLHLKNSGGTDLHSTGLGRGVEAEGNLPLGGDKFISLSGDYLRSSFSLPKNGASRDLAIESLGGRAQLLVLLDAFESSLHQKLVAGAGGSLNSATRLSSSSAGESNVSTYLLASPALSLGLIRSFSQSQVNSLLTYSAAVGDGYRLQESQVRLSYLLHPFSAGDLKAAEGAVEYRRGTYKNFTKGTSSGSESLLLSVGLAIGGGGQ